VGGASASVRERAPCGLRASREGGDAGWIEIVADFSPTEPHGLPKDAQEKLHAGKPFSVHTQTDGTDPPDGTYSIKSEVTFVPTPGKH